MSKHCSFIYRHFDNMQSESFKIDSGYWFRNFRMTWNKWFWISNKWPELINFRSLFLGYFLMSNGDIYAFFFKCSIYVNSSIKMTLHWQTFCQKHQWILSYKLLLTFLWWEWFKKRSKIWFKWLLTRINGHNPKIDL